MQFSHWFPVCIRRPLKWAWLRFSLAGRHPWRPGWLPFSISLQQEHKVHPHVSEEKASLFLAHSMGSTEIEILNWLHATLCMLKPELVVETGAFEGLGTLALADACRANRCGHVHSLEIDPVSCKKVRQLLARQGLSAWATVHCIDSREFLRTTDLCFDVGFFDSLFQHRAEEYELCLKRGLIRRAAAFHASSSFRGLSLPEGSEEHSAYRRRIRELAAQDPACTGFLESNLSRGLTVLFRDANSAIAQRGD